MSRFTDPIRLQLGRSRLLTAYVTLVHLVALLLVGVLELHLAIKTILFAAIVISAQRTFRDHVFFVGDAITIILLRPDDTWCLTTGKGTESSAELLPGAFVHPWLTVLVFRLEEGKRRSVILTQDNVEPDAFRRLRVRLRY